MVIQLAHTKKVRRVQIRAEIKKNIEPVFCYFQNLVKIIAQVLKIKTKTKVYNLLKGKNLEVSLNYILYT